MIKYFLIIYQIIQILFFNQYWLQNNNIINYKYNNKYKIKFKQKNIKIMQMNLMMMMI